MTIIIPNLAGVIKKDDVYSKGAGSYKADYIAWARIAMLLHKHAPGWNFALVEASDGSIIHAAPDATGYLVGQFTCRDGDALLQGPLFPFPVMDNRNNPIKASAISARTLTDSHRRCLCATAAFTFGLGAELWAKMEVDDDASEPPTQKPEPTAKPKMVSKAEDPTSETAGTLEGDRKTLQALLIELDPRVRNDILSAFKADHDLPDDAKVMAHITTPERVDWLRTAIQTYVN